MKIPPRRRRGWLPSYVSHLSPAAVSAVTLTGVAAATAKHLVAASSTITLHGSDLGNIEFPVSASSIISLHGASAAGRAFSHTGSDRFTLTGVAAENSAVFNVGADTITFSVSTHYTPYGFNSNVLRLLGIASSRVFRPASAASTLTLRDHATHTGVHLVAAVSTLDLHGTSSGPKAAGAGHVETDTIIFTATAGSHVARAGIAASTLIFSSTSGKLSQHLGIASDTIIFSEQELAPRGATSAASDIILFSEPFTLGSNTDVAFDGLLLSDTASVSTDFGRFRRGDRVPVIFGTEAIPDFAPILVIFDPSNIQIEAFAIPAVSSNKELFGYPVFVDQDFALGIFKVYMHYTVNGVAFLAKGTFTVIPGGDSGGQIISMFSIDRPEARSLICQLTKGRLVIGSDPANS